MCGIIGIVGKIGKATLGGELREGLGKLEYRGYDSCGIAVIGGNKISVRKSAGKIKDVSTAQDFSGLDGTVALGHSRWATHGGVTDANAHPHEDCQKRIAVVHNGIIENFQALRAELASRGHKFASQTDTEVIPHLIEDKMGAGAAFEDAVRQSLLELKGSYAIAAVCAGEPEKLVVARHESPLIVGVGGGFMLAASDATPMLAYTRKVIFMDDGEMAVLSKEGARFSHVKDGGEVQKQPSEISWSAEQAQKGGYEDFMLKEIMEQPKTVADALRQEDREIIDFADGIMLARNVVIIGMGTARHAGLITRYALDVVAGKHAEVMMASEYTYFADRARRDTIVFPISQSGETADVLLPAKKARAQGAKIYSIVNVVGSTLDRISDKRVYANAGPEIAVASTKAFVNQVCTGMLVAFAAAGKLDEGKRLLEELPLLIEKTIDENNEKARKIAAMIAKRHDAYYIARGINFATALEGALKMKEVSYVHAEGMPAGELKHGTIALVEEGTPVIAINPHDVTYDETLGNAIETKARGAFLIGVGDEPNEVYDEFLRIPKTDELFYPLLAVIPLQLLAYYAAKARGLSPDKPRNLAKSVTVK